uniref:Glutaredoxin-dependent peroxiredoxin n=2 Tax=Hordeum vulgare subsp. vulgare TaxID=112509 RepID=A0A8I6WSK3_HORVV
MPGFGVHTRRHTQGHQPARPINCASTIYSFPFDIVPHCFLSLSTLPNPEQARATMAPIGVGSTLPDGQLGWFDENDQLQQVSIHSLAAGKKVILFGVPGAFTPTCSNQHVPGFITQAEDLKAKGVEEILLVSVNDPFVMKAWAKTYPENKHVKFLADGAAAYTKALGLELDLTEKGLGLRSKRFALLADDLKVTVANIEEGGQFTISGAEEILKAL